MKLSRICLRQFRSYPDQEFSFAPEGAIILGANGSGKTNLFEAIAYCSLGKSVRYQADEQLLCFFSKEFAINADFQLKQGNCNVRINYASGKKNISINQIPVKQLSRIYEYVKAIYCSPDDVHLVNGSPRKRRQYFDMAIAQLEPQYIQLLRSFLHITEQRNALLKDIANQTQKKHWDDQYIQAALPVIGQRLKYVEMLNRKIRDKYSASICEADIMQINYIPTLNPISDDNQSEKYLSILKKIEPREWQYQRSLVGPHLDDYDILMAGRPVKDIGSQGQKRTITLLIKIAQLELIKDAIGEYPILLLDDIFAELDERHTKEFMQILQNHEQVFIASPKPISSAQWHNLPIIQLDSPVDADSASLLGKTEAECGITSKG